MTKFSVIEARPWHCGQMSRLLRDEQVEAMANYGGDVHREMRQMFDNSAYRRAWLIDDKLAALGGVAGSPLETTAYVWVAISKKAQRYPVALIKLMRDQLQKAKATHAMLVTSILPDDPASLRFAVFLGFHAGRDGRSGPALSRFSRHDLIHFIETEPDVRIPLPSGYAMAVAYRGEFIQ